MVGAFTTPRTCLAAMLCSSGHGLRERKQQRHPEVACRKDRSVAYLLSTADLSPANGFSLRNFDG